MPSFLLIRAREGRLQYARDPEGLHWTYNRRKAYQLTQPHQLVPLPDDMGYESLDAGVRYPFYLYPDTQSDSWTKPVRLLDYERISQANPGQPLHVIERIHTGEPQFWGIHCRQIGWGSTALVFTHEELEDSEIFQTDLFKVKYVIGQPKFDPSTAIIRLLPRPGQIGVWKTRGSGGVPTRIGQRPWQPTKLDTNYPVKDCQDWQRTETPVYTAGLDQGHPQGDAQVLTVLYSYDKADRTVESSTTNTPKTPDSLAVQASDWQVSMQCTAESSSLETPTREATAALERLKLVADELTQKLQQAVDQLASKQTPPPVEVKAEVDSSSKSDKSGAEASSASSADIADRAALWMQQRVDRMGNIFAEPCVRPFKLYSREQPQAEPPVAAESADTLEAEESPAGESETTQYFLRDKAGRVARWVVNGAGATIELGEVRSVEGPTADERVLHVDGYFPLYWCANLRPKLQKAMRDAVDRRLSGESAGAAVARAVATIRPRRIDLLSKRVILLTPAGVPYFWYRRSNKLRIAHNFVPSRYDLVLPTRQLGFELEVEAIDEYLDGPGTLNPDLVDYLRGGLLPLEKEEVERRLDRAMALSVAKAVAAKVVEVVQEQPAPKTSVETEAYFQDKSGRLLRWHRTVEGGKTRSLRDITLLPESELLALAHPKGLSTDLAVVHKVAGYFPLWMHVPPLSEGLLNTLIEASDVGDRTLMDHEEVMRAVEQVAPQLALLRHRRVILLDPHGEAHVWRKADNAWERLCVQYEFRENDLVFGVGREFTPHSIRPVGDCINGSGTLFPLVTDYLTGNLLPLTEGAVRWRLSQKR